MRLLSDDCALSHYEATFIPEAVAWAAILGIIVAICSRCGHSLHKNYFRPKLLHNSSLTQKFGFSERMTTYPSAPEIIFALNHHDELVRQCAAGVLSFGAFCAAYDNFYWAYALDGHESDAAGQALLDQFSARIAPHHVLAETVLAHIRSDTHASPASYDEVGRLDTEEAMVRLRLIAAALAHGKS